MLNARIGAQLGSHALPALRGRCAHLGRFGRFGRFGSERLRDSGIVGGYTRVLVAQEQVDNRVMHAHMVALSGFAIAMQARLVADDDVRAGWIGGAGDEEEALPVAQMSLSRDVEVGGTRAGERSVEF
jgi:hypothetical protein